MDHERNGYSQASFLGRERGDNRGSRTTTVLRRDLDHAVDGADAINRRTHFKVFGVGERGLTAQAEATGLIRLLNLGGFTQDQIGLLDLVMGDAFARVLDGQTGLSQGDLKRHITLAVINIGIPGVAQGLTNGCPNGVAIQAAVQHLEEHGIVAYPKA